MFKGLFSFRLETEPGWFWSEGSSRHLSSENVIVSGVGFTSSIASGGSKEITVVKSIKRTAVFVECFLCVVRSQRSSCSWEGHSVSRWRGGVGVAV